MMIMMIWWYDDHHMRIWWWWSSSYEDMMMMMTRCQNHILTENIWLVWYKTSHSNVWWLTTGEFGEVTGIIDLVINVLYFLYDGIRKFSKPCHNFCWVSIPALRYHKCLSLPISESYERNMLRYICFEKLVFATKSLWFQAKCTHFGSFARTGALRFGEANAIPLSLITFPTVLTAPPLIFYWHPPQK